MHREGMGQGGKRRASIPSPDMLPSQHPGKSQNAIVKEF